MVAGQARAVKGLGWAIVLIFEPKFLTSLVGEWIDDDRFRLTQELVYQSPIFRKQQFSAGVGKLIDCDGILRIPKNFVTDFASVPRVPIAYMLFGDRAHHESVPHDYIYQTHIAPKAIADKMFLEAMGARGKPWYVRYPMYQGVVIGGGSSYRSGPERFLILNSPQSTNEGKKENQK